MLQATLLLAALASGIHAKPILPIGYSFAGEFVNPGSAQWPAVTGAYANGPYKQAIYLTFDGMHQFDLTNFVAKYPDSNFASIIKNAVVYSNAMASAPSDSLPATASLFTGGYPRDHGIYWEQSYDRSLYPPGSNCKGPVGTVCDYSESCDINSSLITGGGGFNLSCLPLMKTSWGSCQVVYPHNFLRINTVFEVGRGNGVVTAYADKHLSYEFVSGPSGIGLTQGYFPEIASIGSTLKAQESWDQLHWSALRNWTYGNWANGTKNPDGAPSLYGANFQAITWAQQNAGYLNGAGAPNASLEMAFKAADAGLGTFLKDLKGAGKLDSTLLMIGSKQGQGPINPKTLKVINPNKVMNAAGVPVAFFTGEDGGIMYLKDPADAATAKANLLKHASSLGIAYVLAGNDVTEAGYGDPYMDSRVPDLFIGTTPTELWNSPFEFMDHGGFLPQDLHVPLIAYNPGLQPLNITQQVSNRQVASTMLRALGLPLAQLDGYRLGSAPVLPFLFGSSSS